MIPIPGDRWLDTRAPVPEHLARTYPNRSLRRVVVVLEGPHGDGRFQLSSQWWIWEPGTGDWRLVNRRDSLAGPKVFQRARYQRLP